MTIFKGHLALTLTAALFCVSSPGGLPAAAAPLEPVAANDNRTPAGALSGGVLTLNLRASRGTWHPEGEKGRAIVIEALGESAASLSAPAPLIRVPEGTTIAATIRNELPHALRIHGLCEKAAETCAAIDVPAGETRAVRFESGQAGTYHYWATTTGMPQQFRAVDDAQLSGAFIVDPPGAPRDDRVFVITEWTSLTRDQLRQVASSDDPGAAFLAIRPDAFFTMNGRVWPNTERLRYDKGQPVRWRVVNLSTQVHPMHLHGFYFDVESSGDGTRDAAFKADERPKVVTHVMDPGSTMAMSWVPERPGNWLFHCHVMTHVSPVLHVDGSRKANEPHSHGPPHDAGAGMTGMVLGVTIDGPANEEDTRAGGATPARRITLEMKTDPKRDDHAPAFAFALAGAASDAPSARVPGPTLVLTRGEPVEITLVNRLPEATAIHWHGMELESYYDGVHGFGGSRGRVTPMIEPGSSFVVRFTPPRTGTFMYHTHLHDRTQLTSGLYGAMLVQDPGETFDEATDHVLVIGRRGPAREAPVVINNASSPQLVLNAATRHRLRFINITPDDVLSASLHARGDLAGWTPMTKDGAPVPSARRTRTPARQTIGVGETYDFEFEAPPGRQTLWLELRTPAGRWLAQAHVIVR
jgi:FtsP/CotA-like multicopper oxidase with cupredoxin domain